MIAETKLDSEKSRNNKSMSRCRFLCNWFCYIPRVLLLTSAVLIVILVIEFFLDGGALKRSKGMEGLLSRS